MKCQACSYRYKEMQDGQLVSDGEEPFIYIVKNVHYKLENGSLEECYLFACPRCKTVRIEL